MDGIRNEMLPQCKILFDGTKESLEKIESTNREEFKEIKGLLSTQANKLGDLGEDVAFIRGEMKSNNPGNPGCDSGRNSNNPGNPGNNLETSSITIKWKNLSGLSKLLLKVTTTIISIFLIYGGYRTL